MPRSFALAAALGLAALAAPPPAHAIVVDLGSDGSDGALNVTSDTVLPLPPDGVFNFTTVNVASGATLSFSYAGLFHPGVVILATGDVVIDGTLDVGGMDAGPTGIRYGGPGGTPGSGPNSNPRQVLQYGVGTSLRTFGGGGGRGERATTVSCTGFTWRGAGGGGVVHVFSNGAIRGAGTIDASGGAVPGTGTTSGVGCTTSPAQGGVDGAVALVSPRLEGAALAILARRTIIHTYERAGDPSISITDGGLPPSVTINTSVRPWITEPTATITHIDGVAVTPDTLYALPPGSSSPLEVRVHVVGCVGSYLEVWVQAYGGTSGSTHQTRGSVTPTGSDTLNINAGMDAQPGTGHRLRVGLNCRP